MRGQTQIRSQLMPRAAEFQESFSGDAKRALDCNQSQRLAVLLSEFTSLSHELFARQGGRGTGGR